jgi:hypothetical protein
MEMLQHLIPYDEQITQPYEATLQHLQRNGSSDVIYRKRKRERPFRSSEAKLFAVRDARAP